MLPQPIALSAPIPTAVSGIRAEVEARLASGAIELPLLPQVAMQITSVAGTENADPRTLSDMLKRDAALAAHVLRISNSPLYSPRTQIVSLQQAVTRLGVAKIKEIALVIACRAGVFKAGGLEKEVDEVFRHCFACALFAQEIARQTRQNVEEAFLCGLLHDVGRPVLFQAFARICAEQKQPLEPAWVLQVATELHCRAGAALSKSWALAENVSSALLQHHDLDLASSIPSVAITQLADLFAHQLLDHPTPNFEPLRAHPASLKLEIYPDTFDAIVARGPALLKTLGAFS